MAVVSLMAWSRACSSRARTARGVMPLTEQRKHGPVRRAKDDVAAFAEAGADGSLRLRLINLGINPIKRGDVFVTSGAGDRFARTWPWPSLKSEPGLRRSRASSATAVTTRSIEPVLEPDAIDASV